MIRQQIKRKDAMSKKTKTKEQVKAEAKEVFDNLHPKEWNIVWKDVNELTPYANNARINDQTVPYLKNSIQRFGFKVPLIVDKDGVLVAGHTRLKAALELGMAKLPCVVADDLTDAEVKALRLADNKIAEMSSWDYEMLDAEMKSLEEDGFGDMADFGFASFDGDADLGGGELPPELAGKDLTPDKLPDAGEDAPTASRIIISFEEDQRQVLADILGVKELPSEDVSYQLSKILEMRAANGHSDSIPVSHDGEGGEEAQD